MARSDILAFGPFELDSRSGELRKHGLRVRLAEQPRQVLTLLLERPGELVTREDVRQRLWPADTYVDFDAGLSSVMRKLRDALGDSAEHPRFIETIPRRGYRFIAPVAAPSATRPDVPASAATSAPWRTPAWIAAGGLILGIVAALAHSLSAPRISPEANEAFLKGMAARGRETVAGFRAAVGYFEEAVVKQPDFAMAYAQMADAQMQLVYAGQFAPREIVPRAEAAVQRALALDDTMPLAHRWRGRILHDYYWRWDEGDRELRRALELDPASLDGRTQLAVAALRAGHVDDAIAEAQRVRDLDPNTPSTSLTLAAMLRTRGRFERALDEYRAVLARDPHLARAHFQVGVTYAAMGRWLDAIDALDRAMALTPDNTRFLSYRGFALAKAGRVADARAVLDDLRGRAEKHYVSAFGIALIHDALGEREAALTALARAYDDHALEFSQWRQYPGFQAIEAEPRYREIRRRMTGLP